jgi:hypothetical protein
MFLLPALLWESDKQFWLHELFAPTLAQKLTTCSYQRIPFQLPADDLIRCEDLSRQSHPEGNNQLLSREQ